MLFYFIWFLCYAVAVLLHTWKTHAIYIIHAHSFHLANIFTWTFEYVAYIVQRWTFFSIAITKYFIGINHTLANANTMNHFIYSLIQFHQNNCCLSEQDKCSSDVYAVIYVCFSLANWAKKNDMLKKLRQKAEKTDPNYINKIKLKVISSEIVRAHTRATKKNALKKCHWIEIEWNLMIQRDLFHR